MLPDEVQATMATMEHTDREAPGYHGPLVIRYAWVVVVSGTAVALILLVVALGHPELFAKGLSPRLGAKERADVLASARDFGLKLVAAVGAVTAGLLGWGRLELAKDERGVARQDLEAQRRTLDAQRLTGDADRFARAVDQLGSEKGADVVLGGLFALEALANSAEGYQSQITEVLSAFVREHVRDRERGRRLQVTEQAALTILGRNRSWRRRIDLNHADLSAADLIEADLTGANLIGADLTDIVLTRSTLTGADLTAANLEGADLIDADLTDAVLSSADVSSVGLNRAKLIKADLRWLRQTHRNLLLVANFNGADLTDADLSGGANLIAADLAGAVLAGANLAGADLRGANLRDAVLARANLAGADLTEDAFLTGADLTDATLSGAKLSGATFSGATLTGADFTRADLTGADCRGATLTEAKLFYKANLTGVDLTGADMTGADLGGARWERDRSPVWPSGYDPGVLKEGTEFISIPHRPDPKDQPA